MLLDRRRINKWAKWMALALVIAFGVGFVALGIGTGNLNFSDLWRRNTRASQAAAEPSQAAIKAYETTLAADPDNVDALLGLANEYRKLGQPLKEAEYLEKLALLEPGKGEYDMRLASIYMSDKVRDYAAAVKALQRATALDPNNADAFLQLGIAERNLGNLNDAVLAWTRYLSLAPEGDMADTVRDAIEQIKASLTTTTTTLTTTTTT